MNFSHHLIQDSYGCALRVLDAKLHSARIWDAQHMPNDVVRLHSKVLLTFDSKEQYTTLILNSNVSEDSQETSVLTSLGAAILGCAAGDTVHYFKDGEYFDLYIKSVEQQDTFIDSFML